VWWVQRVWCVGVHGVLNAVHSMAGAARGMCVRIVSRVLCTACSGYPACVGGLSCAQWLSGVTYRVWGVVDAVYSVYSVLGVHRVPCAVQGEQCVCVHRVSCAVQCEQWVSSPWRIVGAWTMTCIYRNMYGRLYRCMAG
jgi:hypothetical protein